MRLKFFMSLYLSARGPQSSFGNGLVPALGQPLRSRLDDQLAYDLGLRGPEMVGQGQEFFTARRIQAPHEVVAIVASVMRPTRRSSEWAERGDLSRGGLSARWAILMDDDTQPVT